jgi:hypothetical protein
MYAAYLTRLVVRDCITLITFGEEEKLWVEKSWTTQLLQRWALSSVTGGLFLAVVGLFSLPYLTPLEAGSVAHADIFWSPWALSVWVKQTECKASQAPSSSDSFTCTPSLNMHVLAEGTLTINTARFVFVTVSLFFKLWWESFFFLSLSDPRQVMQ